MQNAEPSTSVTMPSAPMLALALVVQGSGIAENLLPHSPRFSGTRHSPLPDLESSAD